LLSSPIILLFPGRSDLKPRQISDLSRQFEHRFQQRFLAQFCRLLKSVSSLRVVNYVDGFFDCIENALKAPWP
jgi:hypothetical protein